MWARRFDLSAKAFSQIWQVNGFSPFKLKIQSLFKVSVLNQFLLLTFYLCEFLCDPVGARVLRTICRSTDTCSPDCAYERAWRKPGPKRRLCHNEDNALPVKSMDLHFKFSAMGKICNCYLLIGRRPMSLTMSSQVGRCAVTLATIGTFVTV